MWLRLAMAFALLTSLIFTVPIALWITAALLAGAVAPLDLAPTQYAWADYVGWAVMFGVGGLTFWGIYRICRPMINDMIEEEVS